MALKSRDGCQKVAERVREKEVRVEPLGAQNWSFIVVAVAPIHLICFVSFGMVSLRKERCNRSIFALPLAGTFLHDRVDRKRKWGTFFACASFSSLLCSNTDSFGSLRYLIACERDVPRCTLTLPVAIYLALEFGCLIRLRNNNKANNRCTH